jgi:tRNA(Ile)-lysidine synthase
LTDFSSYLRQFLQKNLLREHQQPMLIAVSGGMDSVCLLHALQQLPEHACWHVAHFDHAARPESASDCAFTASLAQHYQLPFHTARASQLLTSESELRTARYHFLAQAAHSIGAKYIFTAHNANDQAETVLLRLLRGSATAGLSAMRTFAACPTDPALTLVRPFLPISRTEIAAYQAAHQLAYREDASNANPTYRRNFVRQQIAPLLAQINPNWVETLGRTAELLGEEQAVLAMAEEAAWERCAQCGQLSVQIRLAEWQKLLPALQTAVLRRAVQTLQADTPLDLPSTAFRTAAELARNGSSGQCAPLGGHWQMTRTATHLLIHQQTQPVQPRQLADLLPLLPTAHSLPVLANPMRLEGGFLHWELISPLQAQVRLQTPLPRHQALLAVDTFPAPWRLAPAPSSATFQPFGLNGHHKRFDNFFNDVQIPPVLRTRWAVLWAGDSPLWVVGLRPDERTRIGSQTQRVLAVTFVSDVASNAEFSTLFS